jgi:hypothetical protein
VDKLGVWHRILLGGQRYFDVWRGPPATSSQWAVHGTCVLYRVRVRVNLTHFLEDWLRKFVPSPLSYVWKIRWQGGQIRYFYLFVPSLTEQSEVDERAVVYLTRESIYSCLHFFAKNTSVSHLSNSLGLDRGIWCLYKVLFESVSNVVM